MPQTNSIPPEEFAKRYSWHWQCSCGSEYEQHWSKFFDTPMLLDQADEAARLDNLRVLGAHMKLVMLHLEKEHGVIFPQ